MTAPALLSVKNLSRYYEISNGPFKPSSLVKALDDVTFSLSAGKTLAVVGESGCGKSTLARQITMIEKPTSGELELDDLNLVQASVDEIRQSRKQVQIIFQDPYGSLNPRKKVGTIIGEPLAINSTLSRKDREDRIRSMMDRVGLRPEHFDRYPHMFSGGQRQRIAIARALMLEPKLLVADEPVSALDVSVQAQVLNLLMDLQEEMNLAYLFISHDLAVVRHIASEVMVMYLGRVAEFGAAKDIFNHPYHPYTQALLASTPHLNPSNRKERIVLKGELPSPISPPTGCAFHTRCHFATPVCDETQPPMRSFANQYVACHNLESLTQTQIN